MFQHFAVFQHHQVCVHRTRTETAPPHPISPSLGLACTPPQHADRRQFQTSSTPWETALAFQQQPQEQRYPFLPVCGVRYPFLPVCGVRYPFLPVCGVRYPFLPVCGVRYPFLPVCGVRYPFLPVCAVSVWYGCQCVVFFTCTQMLWIRLHTGIVRTL